MDNATRKIRSKSVTFLDEISADEEVVATMMPSTSSYFNGIDAPYQESQASQQQSYLPAPVSSRQQLQNREQYVEDYSAHMPRLALNDQPHYQQQYPTKQASNGYEFEMAMSTNEQQFENYADYEQRQQYQRNGMANSGPSKTLIPTLDHSQTPLPKNCSLPRKSKAS